MPHLRRVLQLVVVLLGATLSPVGAGAQLITVAGAPAQLDVRVAGDHSVRVTLAPVDCRGAFPISPAVVVRRYPPPAISLREITQPIRRTVGAFTVEVRPDPLTLRLTTRAGVLVQQIVFEHDGTLIVPARRPAGARPGRRRSAAGQGHAVARAAGPVRSPRPARHDAAALAGRHVRLAQPGRRCCSAPRGWGLFVAAPWGQVDLRATDRGVFIPWRPSDAERVPQNERNQQQALAKGLPPPDAVVPGAFDLFVFDAHDPAAAMKDFAAITGPAGDAAEVVARLHAVAPDARGLTRRCSASSTRSARSRSRSMP